MSRPAPVRFAGAPEEQEPHGDDDGRGHTGHDVKGLVAGAHGKIPRPDDKGRPRDHHRREIRVFNARRRPHRPDFALVDHPRLAGVVAQIGDGPGVPVGLLHPVTDVARGGLAQHALPVDTGGGDESRWRLGQRRYPDCRHLPPKLGEVALPLRGAADHPGFLRDRQPERHPRRRGVGHVVHGDQNIAVMVVDRGEDRGGQIADREPVHRPVDRRPLELGGGHLVEALGQLPLRGLDEALFEQPPGDGDERPLGLVIGDVDHDQRPLGLHVLDGRLEHAGLAAAGRVGEDEGAALVQRLGDPGHRLLAADRSGHLPHPPDSTAGHAKRDAPRGASGSLLPCR